MKEKKSKINKKEFQVEFLPFEICLDVQPETNLLDATKEADLPLKATCGGKGTCGDCVVQILKGKYQSKSSAALPDQLASRKYALACQTKIRGDITVQLPQFRELSIKSIVDSKYFEERRDNISGFYEIDPPLKKVDLPLPPPTLEDNYSDLRRIERELQKKLSLKKLSCEYSVLKKLAYAVRESQGKISVVLFVSGNEATIIDVAPRSAGKNIYGVACDIGTTTVALFLVDLQSGKIVATASSLNQQITCGEDIISRINYAQKPGKLEKLHELIILTVNNLIETASRSARISPADIYYASLSGNTTMLHLLLNLDPRYIREEPYVPTFNQVPSVLSRDLGLKMNQEGRITCSPAVGSYVGGDITAGILCTPLIQDSKKISLFIDAGTNGELVAGNKDWLMTCACSAGPAFEGSGTQCGMPASEGAIEEIRIKDDGELEYKVIGSTKPKGLCGSGLVDLLAELFIHGYIDRRGKFIEKKAGEKITKTDEGKGFLIQEGKNSFWEKDLIITENDISNLIRTKGAVFSACSILLKNVGLSFDKIDSVYIAGGFGEHLNIKNAIRIGLLPDLKREKFHYLGNSSLLGAYLILLSDKNKDLATEVAQKMTYIELNTEPSYMNEFTGALFLPHTDLSLFPSIKQIFNR
ncbi:MAG: DUF4445 domain-containing protein [Candidatus Aminicenantes bacterium]|nr:DUF4445 domain-containing protein [Candidatus Aminicenantes bacterium]